MIEAAFTSIITARSNAGMAAKLWTELVEAYSSHTRHYHNLQHLENMLCQLLAVKASIVNWEAIVLALAYHDAVYEALAKDNEAQSAALASKRLEEAGCPPGLLIQVDQLIMATKDHQLRLDDDVNFFTDADLSILGTERQRYQVYTDAIREEYRLVPDELYKPGRKKVLSHFIAMPQIFKTAYFKDRYEAVARMNLKEELGSL